MKTIYEIVNKAYDKALLNHKEFRKQYHTITELLQEYDIPHDGKSDDEVIHNEIIYRSLLIKQQFEEVFFDTYVTMFDYWYDLTYQERKKQMNVDIARLCEQLAHFEADGETIYMPAFDASFNHLYHTEIVLLDLKQYHRYIRECAKEVNGYRYQAEPFRHGFSSCELVGEKKHRFVIYHPLMHRWYVYEEKRLITTLSSNPECEVKQAWKQTIAQALLAEDEEPLVKLLEEYGIIGKHPQKKLRRLLQKKEKKQQKNAAKE